MSEDWATYFRNIRLEREAQEAEDAHATPINVIELGHEVDIATLPREPKALANLLLDSGYRAVSGRSKTFQEGAVFKSGDKAGERRPDRDLTWYWVQGTRGHLSIWASYCGGSFLDATVKDGDGLHLFERRRDLTEWLNIGKQ